MDTAPTATMDSVETEVRIEDRDRMAAVVGPRDENLRLLEREFQVALHPAEGAVAVRGDSEAAARVVTALTRLAAIADQPEGLTAAEVQAVINLVSAGHSAAEAETLVSDVVLVTARGKALAPKTTGQREYLEAMRQHDLTFAIGPAGTGKTYLAVAIAIAALKAKAVTRVVLARPAVEAGERLGFLPGDLREKVDPYLRPLYDALHDMLEFDQCQRYLARGVIEIAPLAYMRGRTLNDSFVILDEAQNTTGPQMKMFLTRMGFGTKCVVTGDITQIDLPEGTPSGLKEASRILQGIPGLRFVALTDRDVVRHKLVQRIIRAYEEHERTTRRPAARQTDTGA
ncbi:MAG: phosphate starvation-inducible protein PhoH [Armatimonadetes bacterium CG2_30_66_41]|nr:MAG: phosphate starvation-inducible protein PhoH [Armatimonadetes bacterium CG2_30_66_41]